MLERQLQRKILDWCARHGVLCWKFSAQEAGVPDLICFHNGMVLLLELKSPRGTGRLSRLQELQIGRLLAQDIPTHVTKDLDDAIAFITNTFLL